jgi:hypothetical protein
MMNQVITLLRQLEAYVQEEIGAQGRVLAALDQQGAALRSHEPARILESTKALDVEIEAQMRRSSRRTALIEGLAQAWGVAPSSLSLGSIVQRIGDEGARLARQRDDLKRAAGEVAKKSRRNGMVARFQHKIASDVLQAVLVPDGQGSLEEGGTLVDAEG